MTTYDEIKDELKTELIANGGDLDRIRDYSGEWVDGFLPIYNSDIIKEWQEMPSEYDNQGAEELGVPGDISIVALMQLDLYLYYSHLVGRALDELEEEKEGEE